MLLGSILLALAWAALHGEFTGTNLLVGYVFGYVVLVLLGRGGVMPARFGARVGHAISLFAYFMGQLVLANIRVAIDVMRPQHAMKPAVVGIPLDITGDEEILLLSALINLTPGSVTIDLSDDRRTLYVHVIHMVDADRTRRDIKRGFERRVQRLFE